MTLDKHIQSAIIGFWRQGAGIDRIAEILKVEIAYVSSVIIRYFKNLDLW